MKLFSIKKKSNGNTDVWFAWYPIIIYSNTGSSVVWLEYVTRIYVSNGYDLGYFYEKLNNEPNTAK